MLDLSRAPCMPDRDMAEGADISPYRRYLILRYAENLGSLRFCGVEFNSYLLF